MARQRGGGDKEVLPKSVSDGDDAALPPKLDRQVQARIGEQLRSMYDDLLRQPVPDRFSELLSKLDSTERPKR
jgi:hypothetical protein